MTTSHLRSILKIQKPVEVLLFTNNYLFLSRYLNYISWPSPLKVHCKLFFCIHSANPYLRSADGSWNEEVKMGEEVLLWEHQFMCDIGCSRVLCAHHSLIVQAIKTNMTVNCNEQHLYYSGFNAILLLLRVIASQLFEPSPFTSFRVIQFLRFF